MPKGKANDAVLGLNPVVASQKVIATRHTVGTFVGDEVALRFSQVAYLEDVALGVNLESGGEPLRPRINVGNRVGFRHPAEFLGEACQLLVDAGLVKNG